MYMEPSLGTVVEATQRVQEEHQRGEQEQEEDHLYQQHEVVGQDHQLGEWEHMFDMVLTPSDVGKLNRLVLAEQHAKLFFPAAVAGTLLCFQDHAGTSWWFRYSFWASSQIYVITKGWKRFVLAAKLDAGDTISFSRGAGGRYFIYCCHRHLQGSNIIDHAAVVPTRVLEPLLPTEILLSEENIDVETRSLPTATALALEPPPHGQVLHVGCGGDNSLPTADVRFQSRFQRVVHDICTVVVVQFTPTYQSEEQQNCCYKYWQKAVMFALTMLFAYVGSVSSSTRNMAFEIAMASFSVALLSGLIFSIRTPKWGKALLVYISSFFLVLVTYLLMISFNKYYSYAVLPMPLTIVTAILQPKIWPKVWGQSSINDDEHLNRIFDISTTIATSGGFISVIMGYYMLEPNKHIEVSVVGFLFFLTITLALFLMTITTVRTVTLTSHATCLSDQLTVLVMSTFMATLMRGLPHAVED